MRKKLFKPATQEQIANRPKVKDDDITFMGIQFPVISCLLPTLIADSIKPIEPLVLTPEEEAALHERFRKKFGIDFGILSDHRPIYADPPEGMKRGCTPGVFISE